MRKTHILLPVVLTASVALGGRAALAEPFENDARTEIVRYGDLDLTSPSGVAALNRRIARAVERVCDPGDVRDIASIYAERRCRTSTRRAVNAQRNQALALANPGSIQLSGR